MIEKQNSYQMFNAIAQTYDRINRLLSFGIDRYWRSTLTREGLKSSPQKILDVATGTGEILYHFLKKAPHLDYIGVDPSVEMLGIAKQKQERYLHTSLRFDEGNGEMLSYADQTFDLVTMAFGLRNMSRPDVCLQQISRVLKKGSRCLILEFSLPRFFLLKQLYLFYLRYILPKMGKFLSSHHQAYTYLNKTIESFPYGKDFEKLLLQNGFSHATHRPLSFGIVTLYIGTKQ